MKVTERREREREGRPPAQPVCPPARQQLRVSGFEPAARQPVRIESPGTSSGCAAEGRPRSPASGPMPAGLVHVVLSPPGEAFVMPHPLPLVGGKPQLTH